MCYAMNKTRKYYTTWEKPDTQTSYCVIESIDAKGKGIIGDQVGQPALQLFLWTVPWGDSTLPVGVKSAKEMVIAGGAYVQIVRPWYWIGGFPREKMQTTGRL